MGIAKHHMKKKSSLPPATPPDTRRGAARRYRRARPRRNGAGGGGREGEERQIIFAVASYNGGCLVGVNARVSLSYEVSYDASVAESSGAAGSVTAVVRSVAQATDLCGDGPLREFIGDSALVRNEAQPRTKEKALFKSVRIAP